MVTAQVAFFSRTSIHVTLDKRRTNSLHHAIHVSGTYKSAHVGNTTVHTCVEDYLHHTLPAQPQKWWMPSHRVHEES